MIWILFKQSLSAGKACNVSRFVFFGFYIVSFCTKYKRHLREVGKQRRREYSDVSYTLAVASGTAVEICQNLFSQYVGKQ